MKTWHVNSYNMLRGTTPNYSNSNWPTNTCKGWRAADT